MPEKILKKEIKIGIIKDEDREKVYRFCLSIFDEMGWDKRFRYGLENLKKTFGGKREVFFIAKKDGGIIACAGLKNLTDKIALMKRFYVAKEFRGKGLAGLMFEKIKNFAKKNKYESIVLDVFRDNIRAQKFYQKKGFKIFNPEPDKNWLESQNPQLFEFRKLDLNYDKKK